jgi:hypothetical protein
MYPLLIFCIAMILVIQGETRRLITPESLPLRVASPTPAISPLICPLICPSLTPTRNACCFASAETVISSSLPPHLLPPHLLDTLFLTSHQRRQEFPVAQKELGCLP